jgi:capsular exopolysaccharide synthesis family protein
VTLKDLIRLLQRRWLIVAVVAAVVFGGFLGYSRLKDVPVYRAKARVLISTPPLLVTAAQGTQFISVSQIEPRTWFSIISGRQIREAAEKNLRQRAEREKLGYAVQSGWFQGVTAVPEGSGQLAWIEAVAPSAAVAADVANAVAQEVERYSREVANGDLREARAKAESERAKEQKRLAEEEAAARKIRDDARVRLLCESLELDVRKLEESVGIQESRRRDLERRLAANRLRLERVRADRSVAEHLQREGAPRIGGSASAESRIHESAAVQRISDRIETIHRELLALLRKWTEEHPQVKALREDLRGSELDLTRTRLEALGRDIDREELSLRTDNEIAAIEIRVLEPETRLLRERLAQLSPAHQELLARERAAADARGRLAVKDALVAQLTAAPDTGYVRVLPEDKALPEDAMRTEKRLSRSWPVALAAALILGVSFAFLLEFVDTTLRNDFDVRRHLDFPVLAVVPRVARSEVITLRAPRESVMAEIFDTLATVLLSTPAERPCRTFLVTSTNPEEGKTATSVNLAVALARQGRRTLLIDGDLRMPSIHATLGLPNPSGLCELLGGVAALGPELLQTTELPNLSVITCGGGVENPYELLDGSRIAPLFTGIRDQFEVVVVDTPPILRTGDALKLSAAADAVLFVVEAGKTDQRQATWAKRLLANVGARVSGVILNRAATGHELYYNHSNYSGGTYRREARTA